jgi:hypothetical protein
VRRVIVRYKVKPDRVAENEALVRAVYDELAATQPGEMRYGTFKLDDGVSFVHIHSNDDPSGHNPLSELASFKAFQAGIADRCDDLPVVSQLDEIGTFRLF